MDIAASTTGPVGGGDAGPSVATPPAAPTQQPRARLSDFSHGGFNEVQATQQATRQPTQPQKAQPVQEPHVEATKVDTDSPFLESEETQALAPEQLGEKAQKWTSEPNLDMEAFGSKLVELKTKDGVAYKTVDELRDGNMRQIDYSRSMQEVKLKDQQVTEAIGQFNGFLESVKTDPAQFLEAFERNFGSDYMMKVAVLMAEREQQDLRYVRGVATAAAQEHMERYGLPENDPRVVQASQQASEQMRQRIAADRKSQMERDSIERQRQQFEADQKKVESEKLQQGLMERYQRQVAQLAPTALKALGLNWDHKDVKLGYWGCLKQVLSNSGSNDITRQVAVDAATLLSEAMADQRAQYRVPQASTGQGTPALPSRQAGAGGGVRGQQPTQQSRVRLSEWRP